MRNAIRRTDHPYTEIIIDRNRRENEMKKEVFSQLEEYLQEIPEGTFELERHMGGHSEINLFTSGFQTAINGKGRMIAYQVFPGVQLSLNYFLGEQAAFHHETRKHILEINYCASGRIGWNFSNRTSVYLGTGDLSLHSMDRCADSVMVFPLGYCESISLSINLDLCSAHVFPELRETDLDFERLDRMFCGTGKTVAISSCDDTACIFRPLYRLPEHLRLPYFRLKVQELILYLSRMNPDQAGLTHYSSGQAALISKIHRQLTEHLDRRYTIEELSREYLINTSSLKEVFKGVYGLPIATYMKKYRIHRAMELLRQTDENIAEIAAKVGYETQGKFTRAFKDLTGLTPTGYRKNFRNSSS